ncbi:DUF6318 family protein [Brachybacterium sp. YJGR34]|uniref:DUF6318 family protein n=1 Tax=Brachybacterium sp. YJGR34 TaxID=2059911 RepID=UPI001E4C16ED|nr:DUF6318 family protein [Brachybacterium sp. YJGR34]
MKRPAQRLVVIALALLLVVPIGAVGLSQLLGPDQEDPAAESSAPVDQRPEVDPADQPPRPELPRPEEPAGLTEQTAEGAEATLTYLLESYAYMMSSGDVSVWANSVDPNCQVCVTFLDNAALLAEQDGYMVGGAFEVQGTSFTGTGEPPATGEVTADFAQQESTIVDDPTRAPTPVDAVSGQIVAQIAWDGQRWRVTDMSLGAAEGAGASDAGEG